MFNFKNRKRTKEEELEPILDHIIDKNTINRVTVKYINGLGDELSMRHNNLEWLLCKVLDIVNETCDTHYFADIYKKCLFSNKAKLVLGKLEYIIKTYIKYFNIIPYLLESKIITPDTTPTLINKIIDNKPFPETLIKYVVIAKDFSFSISEEDKFNQTPFVCAVKNRYGYFSEELLNMLYCDKIDLTEVNFFSHKSLLMEAIGEEDIRLVKYLYKLGVPTEINNVHAVDFAREIARHKGTEQSIIIYNYLDRVTRG